VDAFIHQPAARTKRVTPNLGEFMIYALLSRPHGWAAISSTFTFEAETRRVMWYLVGTREQRATCPELMDEAADGRCDKVWKATELSRMLVCFQARFAHFAAIADADVATGAADVRTVCMARQSEGGFVAPAVKKEIRDMHNAVRALRWWPEYFAWLHVPRPANFFDMLIAAMRESERLRYHVIRGVRPDRAALQVTRRQQAMRQAREAAAAAAQRLANAAGVPPAEDQALDAWLRARQAAPAAAPLVAGHDIAAVAVAALPERLRLANAPVDGMPRLCNRPGCQNPAVGPSGR
jgi:hypothetical protein